MASAKETLPLSQRLSPREEYWRDRHDWLLQCGYRLRPRFTPNWEPSWKTSGKLPIMCEDGIPLSNGQVIDATRIEDGSLVALKKVSKSEDPQEEEITKFLSSEPLLNDSRNHSISILATLQPPTDADTLILVLPYLHPFNEPPFDTFGEVIACFRQLFEAVQFMHEHHVAHRDINSNNFMMDGQQLSADRFHPEMIDRKHDLNGRAKYSTRTQKPPKYYLIDFGISRRYDPANGPPLEIPISGGDRTVPEFQNSSEPRDPFPTDVYYAGNMIRQEFIEGHPFLESIKGKKEFGFLKSLVDDMVQDNPEKRPTMDQVVIRFDKIVSGLSSWKCRSRVISRDERFIDSLRRTPSHWARQLGYIIRRVPSIPRL